jgi:starvation-inducible DNA-binding protein
MSKLTVSLNQCLANTFEMYQRAHGMHWNVEGINFPLYHDFFGDIYTEIYGAIDQFAEEIRACGDYAIFGTKAFSLTNQLPECECTDMTDVKTMLQSLQECNTVVVNCLNSCFSLAEVDNCQGLMDFLAGRLDAHTKHGWQIASCLK